MRRARWSGDLRNYVKGVYVQGQMANGRERNALLRNSDYLALDPKFLSALLRIDNVFIDTKYDIVPIIPASIFIFWNHNHYFDINTNNSYRHYSAIMTIDFVRGCHYSGRM